MEGLLENVLSYKKEDGDEPEYLDYPYCGGIDVELAVLETLNENEKEDAGELIEDTR